MKLCENGSSPARIVISRAASPGTRYAAEELAKYLKAASGAVFPVVTDDSPPEEREIVLGRTGRAGTPPAGPLKNDGYILRTAGGKLFLTGENERGDVYAVYGFLERKLGFRFYTPSLEKIPRADTLEIPETDEEVIPPFAYRSTSWNGVSADPVFALKRGMSNAQGTPVTPVLPHSLCHTFFRFVSPDEYFDTHPEYFSMVNGRRVRDRTQLCLTNPDVLAITVRKLKETIRQNPECRFFSVSQMDWYNPCECPACRRIDEEEESHMGTVLRFVNACADAVADEFPDVWIETLAYQYTRRPPKITRPSRNVCVCLCSIECCFTHPMRSCRVPVRPFRHLVDWDHPFQEDLEGWGKIAENLFVWDYTTNFRFYLTPNVNLHVLQDNIRYFLENGVTCLFEQGNSQARSGEFGELRTYLLTRLMWEPEGDVRGWTDEFLEAYCGAGAKAVRRYIDLLADHVTRHGVHAGIYDNPMDVIPDTMLPELTACFDEAARMTEDDPAAAERVDRCRLQLEFLKHHRRLPSAEDFAEEAEKLIAKIRRHGIERIQESSDLETSFAQIRKGDLPDSWEVFWKPF